MPNEGKKSTAIVQIILWKYSFYLPAVVNDAQATKNSNDLFKLVDLYNRNSLASVSFRYVYLGCLLFFDAACSGGTKKMIISISNRPFFHRRRLPSQLIKWFNLYSQTVSIYLLMVFCLNFYVGFSASF